MNLTMKTRVLTAVLASIAVVTLGAGPAVAAAQDNTIHVQKKYTVSFETGTEPGAGTDDFVWIRINGTLGSSGLLGYLDSPADDFENGSVTIFDFFLTDLGTITSVDVKWAESGSGPDWFLNGVKVLVEGRSVWCPNYRWLTGNNEKHLPAA